MAAQPRLKQGSNTPSQIRFRRHVRGQGMLAPAGVANKRQQVPGVVSRGHSLLDNKSITGPLGVLPDPAPHKPGQRVEPIEQHGQAGDQVAEGITTPDMPQFVQENGINPLRCP